jgi:hypothetical protein
VDRHDVATLMHAFWDVDGWRDHPVLSGPAVEQAIEAGLMFRGPRTSDHDETVNRIVDLVATIPMEVVTGNFVASLRSRRLDARSAFGSYSVTRHLTKHEYTPSPPVDGPICSICGLTRIHESDLNEMQFERFRWAGAQHDDLTYALFDLEQFVDTEPLAAAPEDREAMTGLLNWLDSREERASPADCSTKSWPGIKSNKAERLRTLDILGYTSLLSAPEHPGYLDAFVERSSRRLPEFRGAEEHAYPVSWWRGHMGVNREAVRAWGLDWR